MRNYLKADGFFYFCTDGLMSPEGFKALLQKLSIDEIQNVTEQYEDISGSWSLAYNPNFYKYFVLQKT